MSTLLCNPLSKGPLSDGDRKDVEEKNHRFWFAAELKVNLVMAIYPLETAGWQDPGRIGDRDYTVKWTLRNYVEENYWGCPGLC